ncbi:MAG: helix-turn-helix transcriptional regulator [Hyphomicrobiales bacterium]|nr:helix-turn-helix transcriptional regulator [Hyphomicrobiales bacterium]MCP5371699.1 helix-turn-helix transcriptional regulator [Hyphomicrobiales bacterium]
MATDKRDLGDLFRDRLRVVMERVGDGQSRFAARIGVDRSALSQLMARGSTRLPRAETLVAIAEVGGVSLDWLLGLSQNDQLSAEIAPVLAIEEGPSGPDDSRLQAWRREAEGYKIRYVPSSLPDLLRTPAVIAYEHGTDAGPKVETRIAAADHGLAYTRKPETDMEVCMPLQRLDTFAAGSGIWSGLDTATRRQQIDHMARLTDELYPTFRLFLYDGLHAFSAPYTVYGPLRAALYVGDMYLVLNATEHIRALIDHFDRLIRDARVPASDAAAHLRDLAGKVA